MIKHSKYTRGNIYLSGGMEYSANKGAGWRLEISKILKQHGYFPLDITTLDTAYEQSYGQRHLYSDFGEGEHGELMRKANIRKHFVFTDLQLIKKDSDALLVYYDESVRKGAGTISECQVAYLHDIPIFIVSAWKDWKKEIPGWLYALSTKIFTTFDDCVDYLIDLPDGILRRDVYGNHHSGEYYLCSLSGEPFKKNKHHFVSRVSPLYSNTSVDIVKEVYENMKDRYEFMIEYIENEQEDSDK